SHACVSAHLGLLLATRALQAGLAERALVFSFDFISPFVTGGFNELKILNAGFPAPYSERPTGSIGLGDGAAFAVLTRDHGDFALAAQSLHNEMHHFTANRSDGAGFAACLAPLRSEWSQALAERTRNRHARSRPPRMRSAHRGVSEPANRIVERQPRPHAGK